MALHARLTIAYALLAAAARVAHVGVFAYVGGEAARGQVTTPAATRNPACEHLFEQSSPPTDR